MAKPKDPHRHQTVPDDPLQFTEAIAALRDRVPMTDDEFDELTEAEQEYAFTIANVTQADLVADAYEAIERAVRDGTTFEDFQDDVGDALEESWGGEIPGRLETIFRTNVQGAYNAGRYRQMTAPAVADARPYWRFDGVRDSSTSKDICLPIIKAGVVLAADDPWWNGHYPPLHPNCRSIATPLTEEEAKAEGVTRSPPRVDPVPGFGDAPSVTGTDWKPDPEDYPEPIAAELEDNLAETG